MTVGVGRLARVRPGVLLALAALWLCAPAAARASCGDYVAFGPHTAAEHARPSEAPTPSPVSPHAPRPCPCHGPQCSGGLPPPLLPVTTTPVAPEQWAYLADAPATAGRDRHAWWPAPEPFTPRACVRTIFHPPRLS